jgi:hypothetical protein
MKNLAETHPLSSLGSPEKDNWETCKDNQDHQTKQENPTNQTREQKKGNDA